MHLPIRQLANRTLKRWHIAHLPCAFLLAHSYAKGQEWPLATLGSIRDAKIALRSKSESEPIAILKAERIFSDYQRRGFFRIGALPLLVFDRLNVELGDPGKLLASLAAVSNYFAVTANAKRTVEGREFSIAFATQPNNRLQAHYIRLGSGATWILQDGRIDQPGMTPIRFRQATFVVSGLHAGELTCDLGTGRVHLLSLLSKTTAKPTPP